MIIIIVIVLNNPILYNNETNQSNVDFGRESKESIETLSE